MCDCVFTDGCLTAEHEIYPAYRYKSQNVNNFRMPTIVGIFTFINEQARL